MKNLILILTLLVSGYTYSQDVTILHINAKWNTSNDYNLDRIRNAKVLKVFLEEQKADFKAQIKSVPTIVLIGKDGKPKGQWSAGLSFKLEVPLEEIQGRINAILFKK
tara:strand:+ start:3645 stop:3968 length:324 start_codon:yes stop_codon:yes gene_type:complete